MNDDIHKLIALKGCVTRLESVLDIMLDDISPYPLTDEERDNLKDAKYVLARILKDTRHRMLEIGERLSLMVNKDNGEEAKE